MNWRSTGLAVNRWLERLMFIWLLSAMGIGYLLHTYLSAWQGAVVLLFACMTLVTALGTRVKEFGYVARHPAILALVFALLHILLPVIAFGVAHGLHLRSAYVVGVVLASSIPVGVTSVMWTGMADGDLPLGLAIVSLDTLLSPIVIPLSIRLLFGKTVEMPFWTLFWGLVWMVVLPTVIGIVLNEVSRGRIKGWVQPVAGPVSKLSMLAVVAINVAVVSPSISLNSGLGKVLWVLVSMAGSGYLVGYLASRATRAKRPRRVTMTYNVGMRNISAGIAIASQYFGHVVSVPVVLAMLFQQPFATLVFWFMNHPISFRRSGPTQPVECQVSGQQ